MRGVVVPASTVRDGAVFIVVDGRVVRRAVKVAGTSNGSVQITAGLIGGEDLALTRPQT